MSRTPKRGKPPGYEYNTNRPGNEYYGGIPGRFTKTRTHRLERRQRKTEVRMHDEEPF